MKKTINKPLSLILTLCLLASVISFSGISVNAATAGGDESVGAVSGDYQYSIFKEGSKQYAAITKYTGETNFNFSDFIIPRTLDGYIVKRIGGYAFQECRNINRLILPDSVTTISSYAFKEIRANSVYLGKSLVTLGAASLGIWAFFAYAPKTLQTIGIYSLSAIHTIYYEGSKSDWDKTEKSEDFSNNELHYNANADTTVGDNMIISDDFTLRLERSKTNTQTAEIALNAGTYKFKLKKGYFFNTENPDNMMGYNKTFYDQTPGGLTLNSKYKSDMTLEASGGVYRFTFNKSTNVLSVKRVGDMPEVYLTGKLHTVLKKVSGTNSYVGYMTVIPSLNQDESEFKVCKNGEILGFEKEKPYNLGGSFTVSPEWTESCKLYRGSPFKSNTVDITCFVFNADTNTIDVRSYDTASSDVVVSMSRNVKTKDGKEQYYFKLDDGNKTKILATETVNLEPGVYLFKVCNRAKSWFCGDFLINESGSKIIKPTNLAPLTLVVKEAGAYKFTFNRQTYAIHVNKQ